MSLARFNLYRLSYVFLFNTFWSKTKARGGRWSWWGEIIGLAVFWTWYITLLKNIEDWRMRVVYLLISHITTSPLHIQVSGTARSSDFIFNTVLIQGPLLSFYPPTLNLNLNIHLPTRSCSPTSPAPPPTSVPPNPSSTANSAQP